MRNDSSRQHAARRFVLDLVLRRLRVNLVRVTTPATFVRFFLQLPTTTTLPGFNGLLAEEAFAVAFDATLNLRRYCVYLPGGNGHDNAQDVAVDATGIYVSGASDSTNLLIAPQRVGAGGGRDAFVMKLDPNATMLLYATFVGGTRDESYDGANQVGYQWQGSWLALGGNGEVTLTSWTDSRDFPTTIGSAHQGRDDVFVTRLDGAGALVWSTLIGGGSIDVSSGIAADDAAGRTYVVGRTKSGDFPTPGGVVTAHGGRYDAFLVELDTANGAVVSGTFLGGSGDDTARSGVDVDPAGGVYLAGNRTSGFEPSPTSTTFTTNDFAAKFRFGPTIPTPGIQVSPTAGLVTTEGGGIDTFTVVLGTAPTATVALELWSDDPSEGLLLTGSQGPATNVVLMFDVSNWDTPQTVVVQGQQDAAVDGNIAYTIITGVAASLDPGYDGLDPADVGATNLDDETPPGVSVTAIDPATMPAGGSIEVTITGSGFVAGATPTLENGTGPTPAITNVVVLDATTITATITAGGGGPPGTRLWDVRVTNPDNSTGVLVRGLSVVK